MPPKKKTKSKLRKLEPPKELLEDLDGTINDSDTVVGDVNDREYPFITDVSDTESEITNAKAKSTARPKSEKKKNTENTQREQVERAESPSVGVDANNAADSVVEINTTRSKSSAKLACGVRDTPIATVVSASQTAATGSLLGNDDDGAIGGTVNANSNATFANARSTATSALSGAAGTIPKTKAAYKQGSANYELPRQSRTWFDEVEHAERESQRTADVLQEVTRNTKLVEQNRQVAFGSTMNDGYDRGPSHCGASQVPLQPRAAVASIYDQPPMLVIDANVRSLYGDSAYFRGGEYRKPDTRTIYVEGMERMYQNTLQSTFDLLPKEAIEYHIKAGISFWTPTINCTTGARRLTRSRGTEYFIATHSG